MRSMHAMWLIAVVLLAAIYAPVLGEMARIWRTDTYAAHGPLVPLFSAFLLWADRHRLRAVATTGNPRGLLAVFAALGMLVLGRWQGSVLLQGLSLPLAVAGALLWGLGTRCLRQAWFPVAFLALMVPLPRAVVDAVSSHLQVFAATFAASAVGALGVPIYQQGVLLELSTVRLEVAEICNGLRFMTALLVLTIAFAQLTQHNRWRKIVLIAAAVPVAVFANAVRVAALVVAIELLGPQAVQGVIHHSIGKLVWVLTLLPLVGLGLLLRRGGGPPRPPEAERPEPSREQQVVSPSLLERL